MAHGPRSWFVLSTGILFNNDPCFFLIKFYLGYCPHYSSAGTDNPIAVRNDYTKKCEDYSYPCNCSSGYFSTEAYKCKNLIHDCFVNLGNAIFL